MVESMSWRAKLEVIHADVLKTDLTQWGPAVVAGNLPYYITSPILEQIFAARAVISHAVILIQKEVAVRLTAPHGSRDYGYLSVLCQIYSEPKILFNISPGSFSPPPRVDSAVVGLQLKQALPDQQDFLTFASRIFRMKRKTLRNNLLQYYPKAVLEAMPEAGLRAEQLTIPQMRDLFDRLPHSHGSGLQAEPQPEESEE
jgi:16S rRNA (adenine1518-N6/adenine1519-N6)-dimethyltransferase